jgi:hypothetical protein
MVTSIIVIEGKSGTFAVGLQARREQAENSKQHEPGDEEEGCELCAAEARVSQSFYPCRFTHVPCAPLSSYPLSFA